MLGFDGREFSFSQDNPLDVDLLVIDDLVDIADDYEPEYISGYEWNTDKTSN